MRVTDVTTQPAKGVLARIVGCHHHEGLVIDFRYGEIGLDEPGRIEPLGIGNHAGRAIDPVRGDPFEHRACIAALHKELRHEGHDHEADSLTNGPVLIRPVVEPVLPAPRQGCFTRLDARRGEPVGTLPAADLAEERLMFNETSVNGGEPHPASGEHRPVRKV